MPKLDAKCLLLGLTAEINVYAVQRQCRMLAGDIR